MNSDLRFNAINNFKCYSHFVPLPWNITFRLKYRAIECDVFFNLSECVYACMHLVPICCVDANFFHMVETQTRDVCSNVNISFICTQF